MSETMTVIQADVLRRLLLHRLQTTKCLCHVRQGSPCSRCDLIRDAKKAFPETTTATLELFAMLTPGDRS